jgi:hypothetical protein
MPKIPSRKMWEICRTTCLSIVWSGFAPQPICACLLTASSLPCHQITYSIFGIFQKKSFSQFSGNFLIVDFQQVPGAMILGCKPVWALAHGPRVQVSPGLGPVPRGLDFAGCVGIGSWRQTKSGLAKPKLWAHQITNTNHHNT